MMKAIIGLVTITCSFGALAEINPNEICPKEIRGAMAAEVNTQLDIDNDVYKAKLNRLIDAKAAQQGWNAQKKQAYLTEVVGHPSVLKARQEKIQYVFESLMASGDSTCAQVEENNKKILLMLDKEWESAFALIET